MKDAKTPAKPAKTAEAPRGLTAEVQKTLAALELRPEDAALAALALEYARTFDRAAAIAATAAKIAYDENTAEQVEQLRKRVAAHAVVCEMFPKLQAALDALGATPKARAQAPKSTGKPRGSALSAMRDGA